MTLFASTSEIYGDSEIIPTPESYWGKVNPTGPRACDYEGKRYAETLLMAYHKQQGLDVRIPRIVNAYGPRLREDRVYGRVVSRFITQASEDKPLTVYGDGTQTRSFCYSADTITGLMLLTLQNNAKGKIVNVGNSQEVSILELAKTIKELTNSRSKIVFHPLPADDPKRRVPDTTRIKQLIDWKPHSDLKKKTGKNNNVVFIKTID